VKKSNQGDFLIERRLRRVSINAVALSENNDSHAKSRQFYEIKLCGGKEKPRKRGFSHPGPLGLIFSQPLTSSLLLVRRCPQ
jgi:hypothetical protein